MPRRYMFVNLLTMYDDQKVHLSWLSLPLVIQSNTKFTSDQKESKDKVRERNQNMVKQRKVKERRPTNLFWLVSNGMPPSPHKDEGL